MTGTGRRITLQSGLVTTEIALSTVLAVSAVLMFATFRTAITYDRGFEFDNLLAVQIDPLHPPASGDAAREYFRSIVEGVTAIPGMRDAALSSHEIMEQRGLRREVEIEGQAVAAGQPSEATMRIVSSDFFRTTGIPVVQGRTFSRDGGASDDFDLVVNRKFVDLLMSGAPDALGRRINLELATGRIVGVVGDVSPDLAEPAQPMVYLPFEQITPGGMWLIVRTTAEPASVIPGIRGAVRSVDQAVLLERIDILRQNVRTSVAPQWFNMLLVVTFAVLAVTLAGVGIFGVTAFSVTARRSEIAIRRALGATDKSVVAQVARRVAGLTALGVVSGIVASSAGGTLLASLVAGVNAPDLWVVASVALLLAAVSTVAAAIPILRAIRIDPADALSSE